MRASFQALMAVGGGVPFMLATGGNVTTDGNYKVHTFLSGGTFTPIVGIDPIDGNKVEYLIIAGGGAGSSDFSCGMAGGAGGAGGYRTATGYVVSDQDYTITVGAGGVGVQYQRGVNGAHSIFDTITAAGGGGGGLGCSTYPANLGRNGGSGGGQTSGFGGSFPWPEALGNTPATSPVQGYNGGQDILSYGYAAAGGGGAGGPGGNTGAGPYSGGDGGIGRYSSITGTSICRAGGGAGNGWLGNHGTPGCGGGTPYGGNGTPNSGGGGAGLVGGNPGNGGSGVVILRYRFQ
jgi:hypothetical protein